MANAANQVILSTGRILFNDPTLPWNPSNFPNLPSTALTITAAGTIANRNIATLTFPNTITYQNYENGTAVRSQLVKSLVVNSAGNVSYDDPKVSLVSTTLSAYGVGVSNWTSPSIGGAGISNSPPDTLTNAIAKLDAWVGNNLLTQPPAVQTTQIENNSLYAGIRWNNFNVYNVFQYTVPYTTSINMILGDPATGNYLSLQFTNPDWFPNKQFSDGLAADTNPIVRLRIFNKFFPTNGPNVYTKSYMQTQCVRILDEGGTYTLPSTGKVFSIETYPSGDNYTTVNLYLPQIATSEIIPVNLVYLNKTQSAPNIMTNFTSTTSVGGPSAVSSITQNISSPTSFTLQVSPPIYSDATNGISSCYFSTYNINYRVIRMNSAHSGNLGFRFGLGNPNVLPNYLSSYQNSSFQTITAVELGGYQDIVVSGSGASQVYPGIQWSTSIFATNAARIAGSTVAGPIPVLSAFPNTTTPNISSASVRITSPWSVPSSSNGLAYMNYNSNTGWQLGAPLSTNIVFVSTAQRTLFSLNTAVQFNDETYPGCRSNMPFTTVFKDVDGVEQFVNLPIASVSNDFTLNTPYVAATGSNFLSTILTETGTSEPFNKFFYDATVTGGRVISTISLTPQTLEVRLNNFGIDGFDTPIINQRFSTPTYVFQTELASSFNTSTLRFTSTVTSTQQICGLFTPTTSSELGFDLYARNFIGNFANFSSIAMAQFSVGGSPAGPVELYTSSVRIFDRTSEISNLPFPINSSLNISSCKLRLSSNIYQDPTDVASIAIRASVTPANPVAPRGFTTFDLGTSMFIDTISEPSSFTNINSSNGMRVLSLLPRYESPGTANNMDDGIDAFGQASNGIDTTVSSLFIMGLNNVLTVSTSAIYNNASSISSIYTDPYSRELLLTKGRFTHPAGLDFSIFSGTPLGISNAVYPNFTNDLFSDQNYGNRYASFILTGSIHNAPTPYQYVNICIRNPSAVSTITNSRTFNYAFPDGPLPDSNVQFSKVRMHLKVIGAYNEGVYMPLETAWINCFKSIDYGSFADDVYDIGGCTSVSTSGADVWYKVQMDRRYFTSVYPLVRVGISRDGSAANLPAGSAYMPIAFDGMRVELSDS